MTLKALKVDFEKFWNDVTTIAENLGVGKPKLKRQVKPPIRFKKTGEMTKIEPKTDVNSR